MFLALDKEVDAVTDNIETIDFVFLIIYSTEMVMKIIAMGFVMRMNSYLRDTWNCVSKFYIISILLTFIFVNIAGFYSGYVRMVHYVCTSRYISNQST